MSITTKNDGAIIEPPPDCKRMLEKTALLVARKGLEMETRVMNCNKHDERFNFLRSSDPYHAFYQHKLAQYRNQDGVKETQPDPPATPQRPPPDREPLPHPFGPDKFSFEPPQGITLKERAIMKLTAQFVARYDMYFLADLIDKVTTNPLFEFIKVTDPRFHHFSQLVVAYSKVLMRIKKGPCMAEILVKVFFEELQILLEKQEQGLDMAMGDLDVIETCVVDYFTHLEKDQEYCANVPPPLLMGMMQPLTPVSEEQLIAQHLYLMGTNIHFQGSSRTSVSVPNDDDV